MPKITYTCEIRNDDTLQADPQADGEFWFGLSDEGTFIAIVLSEHDSGLLARYLRGETRRERIQFACTFDNDDKLVVKPAMLSDGVQFEARSRDRKAQIILDRESCGNLADQIDPPAPISSEITLTCEVLSIDKLMAYTTDTSVVVRTTGGDAVFLDEDSLLKLVGFLGEAYNVIHAPSNMTIGLQQTKEVERVVKDVEVTTTLIA